MLLSSGAATLGPLGYALDRVLEIALGSVVGVAVSVLIAPARAHHAFAAEFDAKRPVTLRGVVTKMEWVNPHSWIHVDVKTPEGKVQQWMIECGPPGALVRR